MQPKTCRWDEPGGREETKSWHFGLQDFPRLFGAAFSMPWWHMWVLPALRVVLKAEGILFFHCLFFSFFCSVVAVLIYSLYKKQPELCWTLNNKCNYLKHWQLFRYKFIFKLRLVSSGYLDETLTFSVGMGFFSEFLKYYWWDNVVWPFFWTLFKGETLYWSSVHNFRKAELISFVCWLGRNGTCIITRPHILKYSTGRQQME